MSATVKWLLALCLAMVPWVARAADDDLPGRVGRIADFAGQLHLSPEERPSEWEAVGVNYPVTSGDNLWVSGDGRAEIDYGGGQFRIAGDTSLHVSRLDDRQLALFVAQGRLIVRVRVQETGDATRVDTPNTQVSLTRPGLYRIEVMPDRQQTMVAVREGEALVALANGAQQTLPGQSATVTGPAPADAEVRNGIGIDGFDAWSADRDRRYERARSTAYVSRQMVGYADLDEYGAWQSYPDYGAVWFPTTVAAGWAPYRDGYWVNVGGWGYTWVDYAPWGYAPFHYGRWVWINSRWGWTPGVYVARPVWAPALVSWFGGAGWGLSVSAGAPVYGWVPLGWREPYLPWWKRCSHSCWTHYNRPYKVDVTVRPSEPPPLSRHVHFGVPGAVTAVSAPTLTNRRPIPTNLVPVPASVAPSAPVMSSAPTVAPGPAPGPRPRPGVGAAPPPASSFIPPSRGHERGADGARPVTGAGTGAPPPSSRRRPPDAPPASVAPGVPAAPAAPAVPPAGARQPAPAPSMSPNQPVTTAPAPSETRTSPSKAPEAQPGRPRDGHPRWGSAAPPAATQAPGAVGSPVPSQPSVPAPTVRQAPPPGPVHAPVPAPSGRAVPPSVPATGVAPPPTPAPGTSAPPPHGGARGPRQDGETGLKPPRGGERPEPKLDTPSGPATK